MKLINKKIILPSGIILIIIFVSLHFYIKEGIRKRLNEVHPVYLRECQAQLVIYERECADEKLGILGLPRAVFLIARPQYYYDKVVNVIFKSNKYKELLLSMEKEINNIYILDLPSDFLKGEYGKNFDSDIGNIKKLEENNRITIQSTGPYLPPDGGKFVR